MNPRWFKVTFLFPSWRSLNLWKGHFFTIPKRSPAELPGLCFFFFFSFFLFCMDFPRFFFLIPYDPRSRWIFSKMGKRCLDVRFFLFFCGSKKFLRIIFFSLKMMNLFMNVFFSSGFAQKKWIIFFSSSKMMIISKGFSVCKSRGTYIHRVSRSASIPETSSPPNKRGVSSPTFRWKCSSRWAPLPIINGAITPINDLFHPIYRDYFTPFITGSGPTLSKVVKVSFFF